MRAALFATLAIGCGRLGFAESDVDGSVGEAVADNCAETSAVDPRVCVLATGQSQPYGLALTATEVFWINSGDGTLRKCAKTGCGTTPTLIANAKPDGFFVALDATHIYWNHNAANELLRCPLDGCPGAVPELLATTSSPTFVVVDATYVYSSTNDGRLLRVLKTGSAPMNLATGLVDPAGFAISGSAMLWAIRGEGRIVSVPLGGGVPNDVVTGQNGPQALVVDASHIVWSTLTSVAVSDLAGQGVTTLAAAEAPYGLWIDGSTVYWTNNTGSSVMKVPITGGATTVLATGVSHPGRVVVDDKYAYFSVVDEGKVYRIPK